MIKKILHCLNMFVLQSLKYHNRERQEIDCCKPKEWILLLFCSQLKFNYILQIKQFKKLENISNLNKAESSKIYSC